jgi:hypothetical protein
MAFTSAPVSVAAMGEIPATAAGIGNDGARTASTTPASALTATGLPVGAGAIGQQITIAVNTAFNALFNELGGFPASPISGLLEGALVLVRRTVFGLVPTGVTATLSGSTLAITVDPGSTAYFRKNGASLEVSGDPVFFHLLNQQQFSESSVQTVQATNREGGHAGFVFTTGDVGASLVTSGIDSLNFGASAQFGDSVDATLATGTLVLYNAVRGMTGVKLDAPAIRLATDVAVEALDDPGDQTSVPNVTFTGTVDATTTGDQSLTVTALGTTTFAGAVGSTVKLASLLTQGITPLDIPQIPGTSQTIPLYYAPLYSATAPGEVKTGVPVAIGDNEPQFYTFDAGGDGFTTGYNQTLWNGVPLVGPPAGEGFGSGGAFQGPGVTTPITIGVGSNSITTQPIQVLAGVSNTQTINGGPATRPLDFTNPYVGAFNTRFFGDFGVSFSNNISNPAAPLSSAMWQLPGNLGNGFLIQLGPIGNTQQVTVGPTSALIEQFPFAISVPEAVPAATYPGTDNPVLVKGPVGDYTVTIKGVETPYNGIFNVFDTGTAQMTFSLTTPPSGDTCTTGNCKLPTDSKVSATFINALNPADPLTWSFTVGSIPSVNTALYTIEDPSTYPKSLPNVVPGLNLYNYFDVLFNAQKKLIYLRPNGGQATVHLKSVTTTGAQSYQQGFVTLDGTFKTNGGTFSVAGTTTLNGDTTTIDAGAGAVRFSGTVDGATGGAEALVVNTSGAITFVRQVGFFHALSSVTVTGGGSTATAAVRTNRSQFYGGDVSLNGPYLVLGSGQFTIAGATTLVGPVSVSTNGGDITFGDTVDATLNTGFPLIVMASTGDVTFSGAVGATNALGGLAIDSANTVTAGGTVSLDGSLGYSASEGLQIGFDGFVKEANFTHGGSIIGFQAAGGTPNGTGCSDPIEGACGSGVVFENGSSGTIEGFTITYNSGSGVVVAGSTGVRLLSNTIWGNGATGVTVTLPGATGNAILSNSIFSNAGDAIALTYGGNDSQPAPTDVTAALRAGNVLVGGTVTGTGDYIVQVFATPTNNVPEGKTLLGSFTVPAGSFTNKSVSAGTTTGGYITTTVTPVSGPRNTSQFSNPVELTAR